MDNFKDRIRQHDEIAMQFVMNEFGRYDFQGHRMGTETDTDVLRQCLVGQDDRTSQMIRYRPDNIFVGDIALLSEVKSEAQGRYNFAIEFNAYVAGREWNVFNQQLAYVCVDLSVNPYRTYCCWSNEIPFPRKVYIPMRWDYQETYEQIGREWPHIDRQLKDYHNGSGTAYFLISKRARYFKSFDDFITLEVLNRQLSLRLL